MRLFGIVGTKGFIYLMLFVLVVLSCETSQHLHCVPAFKPLLFDLFQKMFICCKYIDHSVCSAVCNADSLNMKIASVKKVWDTTEQETEDPNGMSFGAPLDAAFKGSDAQDDGHHEGFSPGNSQAASTTNVCKVIFSIQRGFAKMFTTLM